MLKLKKPHTDRYTVTYIVASQKFQPSRYKIYAYVLIEVIGIQN